MILVNEKYEYLSFGVFGLEVLGERMFRSRFWNFYYTFLLSFSLDLFEYN